MSGIAGINKPNERDLVERMLKSIGHRGDADPTVVEMASASIGAVRFSQIGEEPGPVSILGDDRVILLDGNLAAGQNPEPEIALVLYTECGSQLFSELEGDFAICIVDAPDIVLARDRLGIRPLYYGFRHGVLCFASEIKALIGVVDEVVEFPPGHFLRSGQGILPYEPIATQRGDRYSLPDKPGLMHAYLDQAVKQCLPADGEVGVWLEGTLDSSLIAAVTNARVKSLKTFAAGIEGSPEIKHSRQVAEYLESDHHERIFDLNEMLNVLEEVIYSLESFDAPLVRSAIVTYLLSEMASKHVSVVVSGEGGEELFAGPAYRKDCEGKLERTLGIQAAIESLHNTELQRVDRAAAASGIQAALPFLNPDLVNLALAMPNRWVDSVPQAEDQAPLQRAVEDVLPEDLLSMEDLEPVSDGSPAKLLMDYAEEQISDRRFYLQPEPEIAIRDRRIRSKDELLYYGIFKKFFGGFVSPDEVGQTVAA